VSATPLWRRSPAFGSARGRGVFAHLGAAGFDPDDASMKVKSGGFVVERVEGAEEFAGEAALEESADFSFAVPCEAVARCRHGFRGRVSFG
jgi:hypothetical protein